MSLNAFAIVVASALPRAETVRLQSPPAISRAAAAMSISGWLVRWLKIQSSGERQHEAADAGEEQRGPQFVEKRLRRRPVLQQHQMADVGGAIAEQWEGAFDELALADRSHSG